MKRSREQIVFARELRQKQTDAERALWLKLKNKQLEGVKFRRQQPLGLHIVDFVSFEKKLVIEIDGGQHNEEEMREKDEERTMWLKERGYEVLRFWNNEVLMNMEGVLERIREALLPPLDGRELEGEGEFIRPHPHLTSPFKGEGFYTTLCGKL